MSKARQFCYDVQVRFRDIDGMGHINNAVYHTYLEYCRIQSLEQMELSQIYSYNRAVPIILARTEIDYVKPGFLSDKIQVEGRLTHISNKSFHQEYEVFSPTHTLAKAKAVLVWIDEANHTSIVIPDEARAILNANLASN